MEVLTTRTVPAVVLSGHRFDFLLKNLLSKEAGHVRVVFEQLELRIDRPIENVSKGLRKRLSVFEVGVSSVSVLC